jgi:hypothetical protein
MLVENQIPIERVADRRRSPGLNPKLNGTLEGLVSKLDEQLRFEKISLVHNSST